MFRQHCCNDTLNMWSRGKTKAKCDLVLRISHHHNSGGAKEDEMIDPGNEVDFTVDFELFNNPQVK